MHYRELLEDFSSQPNLWVHYSRVPYLKINPKPFHQDPMALYFFNTNFNPVGMWTKYQYKFTAELRDGAKVLDLAHISDDEIYAILDSIGAREKIDALNKQYPTNDKRDLIKRAWSQLQSWFAYENGDGKQLGRFNKLFRSLGYDAIFDDCKVVHSSEQQLIVLDPRCIKVIDMAERGGSGFAEMKKVMADIIALCEPYGLIEVTDPKKIKDRYSNEARLEAQVIVRRSEENYLYFKFTADGEKGQPPVKIHVSALYSRPSLNAGYGATYLLDKGQYDDWRGEDGGLDDIKAALEKTFMAKAA